MEQSPKGYRGSCIQGRRHELIERIKAGNYGTDADLAREFNISRDNVHYYRRLCGVKGRRGGPNNHRGSRSKRERIPIAVGVTDRPNNGQSVWTEEEKAKFELFFKNRNLTARALLLRDAKAGKPEAVQELRERFRMRFLAVPACQPAGQGGIGDLVKLRP